MRDAISVLGQLCSLIGTEEGQIEALGMKEPAAESREQLNNLNTLFVAVACGYCFVMCFGTSC